MKYYDPTIEILLFDEDEVLTDSTTAKDEAMNTILGTGGSANAAVSVDINRLTIQAAQ